MTTGRINQVNIRYFIGGGGDGGRPFNERHDALPAATHLLICTIRGSGALSLPGLFYSRSCADGPHASHS